MLLLLLLLLGQAGLGWQAELAGLAGSPPDAGPGVGEEAPPISGNDLDGIPFHLSDYRGKVVMLTFWGDW